MVPSTFRSHTESICSSATILVGQGIPPLFGGPPNNSPSEPRSRWGYTPFWDAINTCKKAAVCAAPLAMEPTAFEGDTPKSTPKGHSNGRISNYFMHISGPRRCSHIWNIHRKHSSLSMHWCDDATTKKILQIKLNNELHACDVNKFMDAQWQPAQHERLRMQSICNLLM